MILKLMIDFNILTNRAFFIDQLNQQLLFSQTCQYSSQGGQWVGARDQDQDQDQGLLTKVPQAFQVPQDIYSKGLGQDQK